MRHSAWARARAGIHASVRLLTLAAVVAALGVAATPGAASVSSGPGGTTNAGAIFGQFTATGVGTAAFGGATTNTLGLADTSTITVGASRTILMMPDLQLEAPDTLEIVLGGSSDVVLLDVGNSTVVDGTIRTTVGVGGPIGGNVWITSSSGITFGPNAVVEVGGLVAATSDIATADFFDGDLSATFAGAAPGSQVLIAPGAQINPHGGVTAFGAPSVTQGAPIVDASAGTHSDVLYVGATGFSLDKSSDGVGLHLVGHGVDAGAGTVVLEADTTAGNIYVGAAGAATVTGTLNAAGLAANGDGRTSVVAGGDLTLTSTARVQAATVPLSTGGNYSNQADAALFATPDARWVVYAPRPANLVSGMLNSGQRARWGATIGTHPPSAFSGNKYVFSYSPPIGFTAANVEKIFPNVVTTFAYTRDHSQIPPGLANVFVGDTVAQAYSGDPTLSSAGGAATARVRTGGYPIVFGLGTLTDLNGYAFVFNSGTLTVIDTTPPEVTRSVTGTIGANGWYTSDVTVSWTLFDAASDITSTGCDTFVLATDQAPQSYSCVATSAGGTTTDTVTLKRDTTAPAAPAVADVTAFTGATSAVVSWPTPIATDNLTASPAVTCSPASGTLFPVGTTSVSCTATDDAGHAGAAGSFTVTVVQAVTTFDRPLEPSPVMNVAKLGRVVPVKLTLTVGGTTVTGASPQTLSLRATRISCSAGAGTDEVEVYAAGSSNSGNLLRWDGTRWQYNLDTSSLGTGDACYRVGVYYGGTVVGGSASGGTIVGSFYLRAR